MAQSRNAPILQVRFPFAKQKYTNNMIRGMFVWMLEGTTATATKRDDFHTNEQDKRRHCLASVAPYSLMNEDFWEIPIRRRHNICEYASGYSPSNEAFRFYSLTTNAASTQKHTLIITFRDTLWKQLGSAMNTI